MTLGIVRPMAEPTNHSKPARLPEEPRRPGVLQVLPAMAAGGVPLGTIEVARATVAAGWRAVVASAGGPGVEVLETAGAKHVTLPLASKNPVVMWRNAADLVTVIANERIDIVHARSRAPAWSAAAAARRTGCRLVTTFHGTYGHANAVKRRYNAVMTRGDAVIAISEHIARHMETVYATPRDRITVIHRGVDPARLDPARVDPVRVAALRQKWGVAEGIPVVLLPGRVTRWKGHTVVVDAIARLGRRDLVCLLVGDIQGRRRYGADLGAQIARHGLSDVVKVVGGCDDMASAYALADMVLSASTDPEAFGRIAIEAQAMGKPIIATAHGGSAETVIDGETGWLVPPGDATALSDALSHLWDTAGARARIGEAGIAHVAAHFTAEKMCAATLALYRSLLTAQPA